MDRKTEAATGNQRRVAELLDKVCYNRHEVAREKIERGEIRIVEEETFRSRTIGCVPFSAKRKARSGPAAKVEKKYGRNNVGPWDDFEWGMLNGKLSVLGDEWDMLDTYPLAGSFHAGLQGLSQKKAAFPLKQERSG